MTVIEEQRASVRISVVLAAGLKVALAALLLFALAHQDWPRFADKAMGARAGAYPLAVLVVPAVWVLRRRRHRGAPFPAVVDVLVTVPFLVDTAGNALDLYDTVGWFDDAAHFGNWAVLSGAIGVALLPRGLPPWATGSLVVGFGAVTAIGWEIAEFGAFVLDTPESVGIYRDTLGDEALGTLGALVAGLATAAAQGRRTPRFRRTP